MTTTSPEFQNLIRNLLLRHGLEVETATITMLDSAQEYEWIARAKDVETDSPMIIVGSDERFVRLKPTTLPALAVWSYTHSEKEL